MQKSKIGKISIFSFLDVKLKFLTSQIKLTQFLVESSYVELKICSIRLKLSWKCEQLDFESSRIQNVNSKLNSMISLSVSDRDKSCALSVILFIASFSSISACLVTQCSFSVTSWDQMLSCAVWTHCRRVWSFVDIIAFTVFKEVWLSLYTLYIFSWHSWFAVVTSARCFILATNSFSSSWWVMTKVNFLSLLSSSQFILIAIIVTSSLLSLLFE